MPHKIHTFSGDKGYHMFVKMFAVTFPALLARHWLNKKCTANEFNCVKNASFWLNTFEHVLCLPESKMSMNLKRWPSNN